MSRFRKAIARVKGAYIAALVLAGWPLHASAQSTNAYGRIADLTTNANGMMIRLEGNVVPGNCVNAPYGWMFIPNSASVMAATVLGIWMKGNAVVTVYTLPTTNDYCAVNQVDPAG